MSKVGEKNNPPKKVTEINYHQDLEKNALKFQTALSEYSTSTGTEEKKRLRDVMDQQLGLIQSAVSEIKTKEIQKQSVKLAKDYQEYINYESDEQFAAVEQDLQTLREYNQV